MKRAVLTLVILLVLGFAWIVAQAGGPVESPSRWNVPYQELRKAFPDSVLTAQQFLVLTAVFQDLSRYLYNNNLATFEAIRQFDIQTGIDYLHNLGLDSTTIRLPHGYKDSLSYIAFVQLTYENPYVHAGPGTGMIAVQWPDSFSVRAINTDSCTFRWMTIRTQ